MNNLISLFVSLLALMLFSSLAAASHGRCPYGYTYSDYGVSCSGYNPSYRSSYEDRNSNYRTMLVGVVIGSIIGSSTRAHDTSRPTNEYRESYRDQRSSRNHTFEDEPVIVRRVKPENKHVKRTQVDSQSRYAFDNESGRRSRTPLTYTISVNSMFMKESFDISSESFFTMKHLSDQFKSSRIGSVQICVDRPMNIERGRDANLHERRVRSLRTYLMAQGLLVSQSEYLGCKREARSYVMIASI